MEQYTLDLLDVGGVPNQYEIVIYRKVGLVIVTDIEKGISVTNAIERIASEVVRQYKVNPEEMTFIEHYPAGGTFDRQETINIVYFKRAYEGEFEDRRLFHSPRWESFPVEAYHVLIEQVQFVEDRISRLRHRSIYIE